MIENITFFVPVFEILNILTWVGIWECINLVMFDEDNLKEEIIKYKHLSKIRVVYNKEKTKNK